MFRSLCCSLDTVKELDYGKDQILYLLLSSNLGPKFKGKEVEYIQFWVLAIKSPPQCDFLVHQGNDGARPMPNLRKRINDLEF